MYDCVLTKGWGVVRIANYLNDEGYTTRSQGRWTFSHIARILRNSIYMGRPRYNIYEKESKREKKSILLPREEWKLQKQNPKLIIVNDTKWQQVQEIMDARTRNKNQESRSLPQKGKLLLNGIARCGYCGSVLKCSYSVKNYQKKSGETTKHMSYRYDCPNGRSHKSSHAIHMFGKKYELSAEEQIIRYIQTADLDSFYQDMLGTQANKLSEKNNLLKQLQDKKGKKETEIKKLKEEIVKVLLGESKFSEETLSGLLNEREAELDEIKNRLLEVELEIMNAKGSSVSIRQLQGELVDWVERYGNADHDSKKMMLSKVIDKVIFKKDEVIVNFDFEMPVMI